MGVSMTHLRALARSHDHVQSFGGLIRQSPYFAAPFFSMLASSPEKSRISASVGVKTGIVSYLPAALMFGRAFNSRS